MGLLNIVVLLLTLEKLYHTLHAKLIAFFFLLEYVLPTTYRRVSETMTQIRGELSYRS